MFNIALTNVIITLLYIVPGFTLCKAKKATADHLSTMSAVLVYACSPCMIISSFLKTDYSIDNLEKMGLFFIVTLIIQALFMLISFLVFKKRYDQIKYRIFTLGAVAGNVGFFGLPVVKALLPDNPEVMVYSAVYVLSMNILLFTIGLYCLTKDRKFMTIKAAIVNPSTIGLGIGLILYCFKPIVDVNFVMPIEFINCVDLLGKMTTPFCMFILGIRLATVPFKKLFTRPIVYSICATKLILFPLFSYAIVAFLPFDFAFKGSILILSSTPCASLILNLAEMHKSETELCANCVLVSTLLCFMTIPVLTLLIS